MGPFVVANVNKITMSLAECSTAQAARISLETGEIPGTRSYSCGKTLMNFGGVENRGRNYPTDVLQRGQARVC
jgi:hypothetical protein